MQFKAFFHETREFFLFASFRYLSGMVNWWPSKNPIYMWLKEGTLRQSLFSQRQILLFSSRGVCLSYGFIGFSPSVCALGGGGPCKKCLSRNASSPHRVAGVTRDKFLRVPLFLQATMGREEFRQESEGNFSGGESVLCACCRQCKVNISEVWSGISNEAAQSSLFPLPVARMKAVKKTTPGQWFIFMTSLACATYRKQIVQFPFPLMYLCVDALWAPLLSLRAPSGICLVA